jgi:hypothetical protein
MIGLGLNVGSAMKLALNGKNTMTRVGSADVGDVGDVSGGIGIGDMVGIGIGDIVGIGIGLGNGRAFGNGICGGVGSVEKENAAACRVPIDCTDIDEDLASSLLPLGVARVLGKHAAVRFIADA